MPTSHIGVESCRGDAVAAVEGYTKRPFWQLPPLRNRPPLAVWASDDRLGTFIAGHPNAPPLAEDIYRLRLLDQEDEQSAEDQQQSGEVSLCLVRSTAHSAAPVCKCRMLRLGGAFAKDPRLRRNPCRNKRPHASHTQADTLGFSGHVT